MSRGKHKKLDITFYFILAVAVIAIAASIFYVQVNAKKIEPYTAVSFDNPEELPNKVKTGEEHSFSYTIQSFEDVPVLYDVKSTLELYRLYDTTEGIYSCLSPYRKKIYVEWTNETEPTHTTIPKQNQIITDMTMPPDQSNPIVWDTYHLEFSLGRKFGKGEFVVYFESKNTTLYKYSFNEQTKQIYYNGEPVATLNMSRQNDKVRISYDGENISLTYNDILVHKAELFVATQGQFGFETRDMYVTVNRMSVHKDKEVEIPDRGNIWEYAVRDNLLHNKISESVSKASKTVKMTRRYISNIGTARTEIPGVINESNDSAILKNTEAKIEYKCENEYACNYLQTKSGKYTIQKDNITELIDSMPDTNYGSNFWLQTREYNDSLIIWDGFKMDVEYDSLFDSDSIFFMFGEDFAVQINKGSYSLITNEDEGIVIEQYPVEGQKNYSVLGVNQDNFSMLVDNNKVTISIGGETTTKELSTNLKDKPFKMFHLNTFSSVRKVDILNSKEECNVDDEFYEFCEIIYEFKSTRPATTKPDPGKYGSLTTTIPTTTNNQNNGSTGITNPDSLSLESEEIPTKTMSFDGPISIIRNKTNMTFATQYKYLDGKGIVSITMHDLNGEPILKLTTDAEKKHADVEYLYEGNIRKEGYLVKINRIIWQDWKIYLNEEDTEIVLNNTKIFKLPITPRDGYFSITAKETHIEQRQTYLHDRNIGSKINFPLLEDPCKLRLVYEEELFNEKVGLVPKEEKTIENTFKLGTFFDYGLVKTTVNGSSNTNNTALDIQFWMVRT